jgi:hypothetical protein
VALLTRLTLVLCGHFRSRVKLEAENLVLRQQLSVLNRRSRESAVGRYVVRTHHAASQGWKTFLGTHASLSHRCVGYMQHRMLGRDLEAGAWALHPTGRLR